MTLRVSEVYPSVQGEGPNVGVPTTFVRFGGCNLRCPGWPCDTPHAIFPNEYRQEWKKHTPQEVVDEVQKIGLRSVCLTGGEPMLQSSADIVSVVRGLDDSNIRVEMFSNGTLEYPPELVEACSIVMDWKLPGSGEAHVGNDIREENLRLLGKHWIHAVKFTIANEADFYHAHTVWMNTVMKYQPRVEVFAGIVWGKELTNERLVDLILEYKLPWRLNVQVHNHIWDRTQRGI